MSDTETMDHWNHLQRLYFKGTERYTTFLAFLSTVEHHTRALEDLYAKEAPANRLAVPALPPQLAALLDDHDRALTAWFRGASETCQSRFAGLEFDLRWKEQERRVRAGEP